MKLLLLWHAGTVPQYLDRYRALERYFDDVTVVVPEGWKEVQKYPPPSSVGADTQIQPLSCWFSYHPYTILYQGLGALIERKAPDVIYVHEEPPALSAAQAAFHARRRKTPLLLDSALINKIGYAWGGNVLEQFVYSVADIVYYRNGQCRQTLRERGCPESKLRGPMPNGVSERTFSPVSSTEASNFLMEAVDGDLRAVAGKEAHSQEQPLRVGFAGRICYEKGIDDLILLARKEKEIEVFFCGPMVDKEYEEVIEEHTNAHYLGEIEGDRMNAFYSACDLTVLPSRQTPHWEEQFGRVLIESISCGTPALGSNVGMIEEIVGSEGVFPEGEGDRLIDLVRTFRNPRRREVLHETQKQRVQEKFSWSKIAERVWQDVQTLSAQNSGKRRSAD
jgi:glycosyltransferase involved in cell wall biosynthesis